MGLGLPQSNQRGIETQEEVDHGDPGGLGLNRTSVGLKPRRPRPSRLLQRLPQSNQRGIETPEDFEYQLEEPLASIEPAWD